MSISIRLVANDRSEMFLRGDLRVTRSPEFFTVAQLEEAGWIEESFQDAAADPRIEVRELDENGNVLPLRWRREIRPKDPLRFTTAGWEHVAPQLYERKTSSGWVEWKLDQHLEQKGA